MDDTITFPSWLKFTNLNEHVVFVFLPKMRH